MMKKYFLFSFLMPLVLVSVLVITPASAHAGWFGPNSFAAGIGSFFNSIFNPVVAPIKSVVSNITNSAETELAECIPPISPKPAGQQHALGTMTIVPEISQDSKNNTITISLVPHINSLTVELSSDIWLRFSKDTIVDWGPKPAELPLGGKGVNITTYGGEFIRWETYEYGDNIYHQTRPRLPAQKYWVKVKAHQTTPWSSNENLGSYGWKEIKYAIHYVEGAGLQQENFKTVTGNAFYYVGGPQYPVGKIVRVGNNVDTDLSDNQYPQYGKSVTLKAGEPFEIEAKPTGWQGGTLTIDPSFKNNDGFGTRIPTGSIIGPTSITVKAGESAIWKVLPGGARPVQGRIDIKNNCNDLIAKLFQDRYFSTWVGSFETPIIFDFKGVTKEKMRLTFQGAIAYVLDFKNPQSSLTVTPWLSLMDQGTVVVDAPDQTIVMQAVYKDNPEEIVKNVLIAPEGKAEQAGSSRAITNKEGTTRFKVRAPNITKPELSRGILLKTSVREIEGLTSQVQLLFTNVVVDVIQPPQKQPEKKPETKPEPTPEVKPAPVPPATQQKKSNVSAVSLSITSNRKLEGLKEGDAVVFKATLTMSDGSTKQITNGIQWTVAGQIGSITPNGVFLAQLDPVVAEYGEGLGAIVATYKDANGKEFIAQTSIFKVETFVPEETETRG